MIDKIKIKIEDFKFTTKNLYNFRCENTNYPVSIHTKYSKGYFNNFKYTFTNGDLILDGSLTKYYLGTNCKNMFFVDIELAIDKLSKELGFDIRNEIVYNLEFGLNIPVNDLPVKYIRYFTHFNYLKSNPFWDSSIYFFSKNKQTKMYDKKVEIKNKYIENEFIEEVNLFRYEIFIKSLKNFFKTNLHFRVRDLYNEKNYKLFFDFWLDNFNKIKTTNVLYQLDKKVILKPSHYRDYIIAEYFHEKGFDKCLNDIEFLKSIDCFEDRNYYCRIKTIISNACNHPQLTQTSELLEELKKKVNEAKRFYC